MPTPNSDTLLSEDALDQLRLAAKAMHDLAEGLDHYACEPDPTVMFQISSNLSRTGWNSLYTAGLMSDLAHAVQQLLNQDGCNQSEDFFQQADTLFTAIKYLTKNVEALRESAKVLELNHREDARTTVEEISQRLKEVLHECKSF